MSSTGASACGARWNFFFRPSPETSANFQLLLDLELVDPLAQRRPRDPEKFGRLHLIAAGFREDLFYRINVIPIHLPPLRERREDIPLLAEHFLAKYAAQMEKPVRTISHEACDLLTAYSWPGNVRELENAIERAVALEQTPAVLPELGEGFDLEARGEEFYRHYIALALERAGGVQTRAAELLGMSFRSFRYYAKKFNIR